LGFIVRDIATLPGPDYQQIERRLVDQNLVKENASLQVQIEEATRAITSRKERQSGLRDSTSNSERTMTQLLELQKLMLQKGVTPSADGVKALSDSQNLFLTNQTKYQALNELPTTN
jgi:hypothetical protein